MRLNDGFWAAGALAWLIFLSLSCLLPLEDIAMPSFELSDKVLHFVFFFLGAAWIALKLPQFSMAMMLVLLGVLIEALQAQTPWRSAEALDWLADSLGVICAWGMLQVAHRRAWV